MAKKGKQGFLHGFKLSENQSERRSDLRDAVHDLGFGRTYRLVKQRKPANKKQRQRKQNALDFIRSGANKFKL